MPTRCRQVAVLGLVLGVGACGDSTGHDATAAIPPSDTIAASSRVPDAIGAGVMAPALIAVVAETAYGRTGPGGQAFEVTRRTAGGMAALHGRMGVATFDIALRPSDLLQYPCTSCHAPGPRRRPADASDPHQDIRPTHPAETGAACATCHVGPTMDRLGLQSGETASLDQPYRLCAQCHFAQADAWAGGAHGKRLEAWHGRRVVLNCTDCHDPHRPGVPQRVPYPGPTLPRPGESR